VLKLSWLGFCLHNVIVGWSYGDSGWVAAPRIFVLEVWGCSSAVGSKDSQAHHQHQRRQQSMFIVLCRREWNWCFHLRCATAAARNITRYSAQLYRPTKQTQMMHDLTTLLSSLYWQKLRKQDKIRRWAVNMCMPTALHHCGYMSYTHNGVGQGCTTCGM